MFSLWEFYKIMEYCCRNEEYRCSHCHLCYTHDHDKFFIIQNGITQYYYRCHLDGFEKPAYPDYYIKENKK